MAIVSDDRAAESGGITLHTPEGSSADQLGWVDTVSVGAVVDGADLRGAFELVVGLTPTGRASLADCADLEAVLMRHFEERSFGLLILDGKPDLEGETLRARLSFVDVETARTLSVPPSAGALAGLKRAAARRPVYAAAPSTIHTTHATNVADEVVTEVCRVVSVRLAEIVL